ncbi:MAG: SdpI family protein [Chitinophagaceae bacterium]|nr:SdpI family protein [Chitinophagaceae bacterium]
MKKFKMLFLQLLIGLIPIIYTVSIWPDIPESVPIHYNMNFIADKFGTKSEIIIIQISMLVISFIMSLLLINLHKLDPKRRYSQTNTSMIKISWTVIAFITLISICIIYKTANYTKANNITSDKYLIAFICLLLVFFGNFINNIKQNYFVGIRTPWNLKDESNWRKTHYLGSKIWFFGGLIMFILVLILPRSASLYVVIAGLIPLCTIPFWYSYHLYNQKKIHKPINHFLII